MQRNFSFLANRKNLADIVAIFKNPPSRISVSDMFPDDIDRRHRDADKYRDHR